MHSSCEPRTFLTKTVGAHVHEHYSAGLRRRRRAAMVARWRSPGMYLRHLA